MAGIVPVRKTANKVEYAKKRAVKDSKIVQVVLTTIAILFFIIMLIVPLVSVFVKAFEQGANLYFASITDPIALKAIKLTLITIAITVPINTIFGLAAAWAIAKFKFFFHIAGGCCNINCRGRSCADPGGKRLENLLVHYAPQYKMGAAVRRYADNCKGFRCIRAYQRSYQYGSSSC